MKTKLTKILTIVFAASMLLTGCNNSAESNNSIESNNKLTIVTSFYPMYISTLNIVKDIPDVEVINMTAPQTGCLHDYSLSTKDLKTLSSADIFVINGAGMESFLDDVIDEYSDLKIIEASKGIDLIEDTEHVNRMLYKVVRKDEDLLKFQSSNYIIKMHGDIYEDDSIVLKEEDYLKYSSEHRLIETMIKSLFLNHTFLFIGYSLNDYNLKLIISWVNEISKQYEISKERCKHFIVDMKNHEEYEIEYYEESGIYGEPHRKRVRRCHFRHYKLWAVCGTAEYGGGHGACDHFAWRLLQLCRKYL